MLYSRDDFNIWNDDLVMVRLDPFADARNNLALAVNSLGSQFDVKQVNALSDSDRYDSTFNMVFSFLPYTHHFLRRI